MGRGELGDAPNWAIPFCNAEAERVEKRVAASLSDFIFIQSYEALLDMYGAVEIADDINRRMMSAGYTQVSSEVTDQGVATTLFVNPDAGTSYTVIMSKKTIDYYLMLIKRAFPATDAGAAPTSTPDTPTITSDAPSEEYWIRVKPTVIPRFTVYVEIETNLPDEAVLSVSLALTGQNPDEPFIGTDFERVPIVEGKGEVLIDGNLRTLPPTDGFTLPPGIYEVQAAFHPLWAENRGLASDLGVTDSIYTQSEVHLGQ